MPQKHKSGQAAHGSYIAQADHGSIANINVTQQAPLKTVVAVAPSPPPNFTGRADTLSTLKDLLINGHSTAITALQGMGGIGKTATAQKLAADITQIFPGGVFWASLPDSSGDPLPILRAWARICAYDLPVDLDQKTLATIVRGLLSQRRSDFGPILVIIDDIRQNWLKEAQLLRTSLPPDTPFLLTTREEVLAHSLGANNIYRLDTLHPNESIDLLKSLVGEFVVENNVNEVLVLLETLGHLPLAIQLAGKRLSQLLQKPGYHLNTFLKEVEKRATQVLILPGHPGLAATFELTYSNLDPITKQLFRWLGVFAIAPISLQDIEGVVVVPESGIQIEDLLDELVQFALLNWSERPGSYTLHPLVRQYAEDLLHYNNEDVAAYKAYIKFYSTILQTQSLQNQEDLELDSRLPNFLLASNRAYGLKDWNSILIFANGLAKINGYLYVKGYWDVAIDLLTKAVEASENIQNIQQAIELIFNLAMIKRERGFYREAQEFFEDAIKRSEDFGDNYQLANAQSGLGYVFLYQANYIDAERIFTKAVDIAENTTNQVALAEGLLGLARVKIALDDKVSPIHLVEKSIPLFETTGDTRGLMWALRVLGNIYELEGNYNSALLHLHRSIHLARTLGHQQAEAYMQRAIGDIFLHKGELVAALDCLRRSEEICRLTGEQAGLVATLCRIGDISVEMESWQKAKVYYSEAVELAKTLNLTRWLGRCLFGLAKIYFKSSDPIEQVKAVTFAVESLSRLEEIKHRDAKMVRDWLDNNRTLPTD